MTVWFMAVFPMSSRGLAPRRCPKRAFSHRECGQSGTLTPELPPSLRPLAGGLASRLPFPASPRADGPVFHTIILCHILISGWLGLIWFLS